MPTANAAGSKVRNLRMEAEGSRRAEESPGPFPRQSRGGTWGSGCDISLGRPSETVSGNDRRERSK